MFTNKFANRLSPRCNKSVKVNADHSRFNATQIFIERDTKMQSTANINLKAARKISFNISLNKMKRFNNVYQSSVETPLRYILTFDLKRYWILTI